MIAAQLLFLEAEDPDKDICLYVNSPGGSAYADGDLRHDAVRQAGRLDDLRRDGDVGGGDDPRGRRGRQAHGAAEREGDDPPGLAGFRGTPADIEIHAQRDPRDDERMAEILAKHAGQPFEQVMLDIDRDRFMTPTEAVEYGLVDKIVEPRAVLAA